MKSVPVAIVAEAYREAVAARCVAGACVKPVGVERKDSMAAWENLAVRGAERSSRGRSAMILSKGDHSGRRRSWRHVACCARTIVQDVITRSLCC